MTKEEVLQKCTVDGNVVKLPNEQLERKLYQDVAKALELIGGKWKGGKVFGFVFPNNPTDLLNQIANGEKRNLKKEFQFFATPSDIADRLVELADLKESDMVLEPSAGQGAIVKAILRKQPSLIVHTFELMDINRTFLQKINDCVILGDDFLSKPEHFMRFDKVIANPPFSGNQDIDHIRKMYEVCKSGGRIVSIASKHWQLSNNRKESEFRDFLKQNDSAVIELPVGSFKESGTNIAVCIIVINK